MQIKFILYIIVTPFVILALDSININQILKKNKGFQAKLLFFFIALVFIYLITNCIYECATISKIF